MKMLNLLFGLNKKKMEMLSAITSVTIVEVFFSFELGAIAGKYSGVENLSLLISDLKKAYQDLAKEFFESEGVKGKDLKEMVMLSDDVFERVILPAKAKDIEEALI